MEKSIYSQRYQILVDLLVALRLEKGISQTALAVALQITQSTISKCERRERRLDVIEVYAWCEALGTPFMQVMQALEQKISAPRSPKKGREPSSKGSRPK
jgi:transcriptional regulator with XRE-family HTH domain